MPGSEAVGCEVGQLTGLAHSADFFYMFILDTNVISELRKVRLGRANANLAQ